MPRATRNVWKDNARQAKEWAPSQCPICGSKFQYRVKYPKPVTCGMYACLPEAAKRELLDQFSSYQAKRDAIAGKGGA